ncbi:GSCFA domain-containing protein [Formosa sediminum]|uniref:GSCFA domain-containing protein n=1 Tax=Formosa sediminum TaxID=2594004 RepID=A0A516GMH8_9FLAO|nr:GSCFA domain-containing protein [Formosa sediminum]QDO92736.1 GSCFA domain-containing protein [Formosa sediminum]
MKFFTEIPIQQQTENQIDYQSKVLLLGSCFVENIGQKLDYYKFNIRQNPFGVLFQPKAIEQLIQHALQNKQYVNEDVFKHQELWHCYDAHSKLSGIDQESVLQGLNLALQDTQDYLKTASHIIITLGTAWVYKHLESCVTVANCHKVPQKAFKKELLSPEEVAKSLQSIIGLINSVNPNATVICTVSPIRHIKDGYIENSRSKSHLLTAIHQVLDTSNRERLQYFPSYEIMMDELRDYRFYASDLVHPNAIAIDYIWEKFSNAWVSSSATKIMQEVQTIQTGLSHKPFNATSEAHQKFIKDLHTKIKKLQERIASIDFKV